MAQQLSGDQNKNLGTNNPQNDQYKNWDIVKATQVCCNEALISDKTFNIYLFDYFISSFETVWNI